MQHCYTIQYLIFLSDVGIKIYNIVTIWQPGHFCLPQMMVMRVGAPRKYSVFSVGVPFQSFEHLVLAHDSEIEAVSKAVAPVRSSPFVERWRKEFLDATALSFSGTLCFGQYVLGDSLPANYGHSSLQILVPYTTHQVASRSQSFLTMTPVPNIETWPQFLGHFLRSQIPAKPCPPAKVQAGTSVKSIEIGQEICRPTTGDWHVAECVYFKIIWPIHIVSYRFLMIFVFLEIPSGNLT